MKLILVNIYGFFYYESGKKPEREVPLYWTDRMYRGTQERIAVLSKGAFI